MEMFATNWIFTLFASVVPIDEIVYVRTNGCRRASLMHSLKVRGSSSISS